MKKGITMGVCLLLPLFGLAQQNSNDTLMFSGFVLVTNNGFAPIPAFSYGKPTIIAALSFKKKKFSYQPDFALGLNGDLWLNSHWLRFSFYEKRKVSFHTGFNPNLFFKHDTTHLAEEAIYSNRNLTVELGGRFLQDDRWFLTLTYRYNHSVDRGSISGHFLDLGGNLQKIPLSKKLITHVSTQVFFFNHTGRLDGLFGAVKIEAAAKELPLLLAFFQGTLPFWSNMSPPGKFQWNVGIKNYF